MDHVSTPAGGAIRIGAFVLDLRSGELCGEAGRQMLSGQPLALLLALAERPGTLVTREELRSRIWPADTFVDFEHGLNAVVKRLRHALEDTADAPRYIETVPRRGYRLVAAVGPADGVSVDTDPVAHQEATPEPARAPAVVPAARRAGTRVIGVRIAVVAAALLATGSMGSLVRWRPAEAAPQGDAQPAHPTRLTFGPGLQTDVSWSPDGHRIAYASDRDGSFDLFTQDTYGGQAVRITTSPNQETQPAWSPDGQRLVFRSSEDGGGLFIVSSRGGPIRRVSDFGFHPLWMPDGRRIAFSDAEWIQKLYVVSADGGEAPREILAGQLNDGAWASFSVHPDGRIGVYGVHPRTRYGFYVSDRGHRVLEWVSRNTPLPVGWHRTGARAHWSRAGDTVFVEYESDGLPAIWRVPVDPVSQEWRTPARVPTGPVGAVQSSISPDGTRLAFTSIRSSTRVWVFPFDADRGTPPGEGRPVTDEDAIAHSVALSRDGGSLFYSEARPGLREAPGMRYDLATGTRTTIVGDSYSGLVPASGDDGTAYMLSRPRDGRAARGDLDFALIWRLDDGRERLLTPWSPLAVIPTDVHPDGGAVLGTAIMGFTGPAQLVEWKNGPAHGTGPARVLLEAERRQFWQGRYSPDGRWVSVIVSGGSQGTEIGIAPAESRRSSTWTRIAGDHDWPDKPRWSPDGRTLYFLSRATSGFFELWGVRIDPRRGAAEGPPFRIRTFDSPRWHIDPTLAVCEMGVGRGRLALPMRTVSGSIWMLSTPGTE